MELQTLQGFVRRGQVNPGMASGELSRVQSFTLSLGPMRGGDILVIQKVVFDNLLFSVAGTVVEFRF